MLTLTSLMGGVLNTTSTRTTCGLIRMRSIYRLDLPATQLSGHQESGDRHHPCSTSRSVSDYGHSWIAAGYTYLRSATCIHWQVSQATSLYNIVFKLSSTPGTRHRAVQMENGRCGFKLTYIAQGVRNILTRVQSGGFMGDLIIDGGDIGLDVGNQQFTVRNVTISGSNTGVKMTWNWGWNFQGITIRNVKVGLDVKTGSNSNDQDQGVGGVVIMDGIISDTPIFYRSSRPSTNLQGSIVLNNIKLMNVQSVVAVLDGETILQGSEGESIVDTWVQGNIYVAKQFRGYHKGGTWSIPKDPSLLENGRMFGKGRPTYADYDISQIVSVKDEGAKGDGRTDDTLALQAVFDKVSTQALLPRPISNGTGRKFAGCKIFFFDAGTYLVTDTLKIPAGVRLFGEAWAVIAGTGNKFDDIQNPQVVVRVGDPGSEGVAEIGGVIFSTRGPSSCCAFERVRTCTYLLSSITAAGAIVLQWNVHSDTKGGAGLWDSYVRLGGTAGSELQVAQCPKHTVGNRNCFAAFLAVHLTPKSNGYFEGTWIWLADHDFETLDGDQTTIYSARGLLSESQGPVWLVGTGSEHHILVNYNLAGAANHYLGLPQTESPYFQPNPPPPGPLYTSLSEWKDPIFTGCEKAAWGLHVTRSRNILVFGAGLYSFFVNYDSTTCNRPDKINCQREILHVDGESGMSVYSLVTVGVVHPLSIDRTPTINAVDNRNGFGQTVTVWKSS